jgi:hypothetical protein
LFYLGILDAAVLRVAAAMAKASLIDLLIAQALSSSFFFFFSWCC